MILNIHQKIIKIIFQKMVKSIFRKTVYNCPYCLTKDSILIILSTYQFMFNTFKLEISDDIFGFLNCFLDTSIITLLMFYQSVLNESFPARVNSFPKNDH